MKKAISVLLTFVMIFGAVAVGGMSVSALPDGHISWDDTGNCYEISSYAELKEFAAIVNGGQNDINAKLTADIDASASDPEAEGYDSANAWTPIGYFNRDSDNLPFIGTFDGCGYRITGLTYNNPQQDNAGLFGYVGEGGKVRNVGLEGGSMTGGRCAGGVVGYNYGGIVSNCYNTGSVTVTAEYANVGGIAGINQSGTISNCYNTGSITAKKRDSTIGGVAGWNAHNGTVASCYNTGSVSGEKAVGGVVGDNYSGSKVTNCYNMGSVTAPEGNSYVGGVVGSNWQNASVENCYYDSYRVTGIPAIGREAVATHSNVKGLSTDEMTGTSAIGTADNQMNFSDTSVWLVRAADEFYSYYPHLKGFNLDKNGNQILAENILMTDWPARAVKDDAREISNYDELKEFASAINDGNLSLKGILINDIDASASNPEAEGYDSANDWTPIGNEYNIYTGTFDGDGHIITGLTFNNPEKDFVGLFGYVGAGGKVQNVGLEGSIITGRDYVGGVAGYNYGTVTNCYNTGSVTGSNFVGGAVGYNDGTVTNCYNTGSITVPGSDAYAGGVAGYNYGTVTNCYNTGAVSGNGYVGGVAGMSQRGTVENCCNTGSVTATDSGSDAGGVAGCNDEGTVTNCYNTGSVTGNGSAGGVVGFNYNNRQVENCYYDKSVCGELGAVNGADSSSVKGLTTAQMTGDDALENMTGFGSDNWLTKADEKDESSGNYRLFYPHLKGFNFNYDLTQMTGDEIEAADWPAKVEITVGLSDGNSCTYDGEKHGVYVTVGDTSVPEGASVTYFQYMYNEDNRWEWKGISDTPTETGKYRMEFDNDDGVVETKYFTILDPYTDFTVSYYKKTGEDWSTDPVTPVDAGDYKAVVTFTAEGHTPIEKVFNIAPKPVAVTACGPDGPIKAYNGQEQVHTDFVIWIYDREETGLDDSKLRYTGNTTVTGTDAGRHSVDLSAEYCFCDDSNYDVTFTAEGDFDFDIAKSVLTITADDLETNYGEDLAGLTYKIESRFGSYYNTDDLGITLSTDADKNKAGTYDITVTVPDNPNYLITTQNGTYTVRQIDPVATVTAEDIDYGQKAVVTFTAPADASGKVTFTLDEAETGITKDIENGQAVCEFESLGIGSHKVECVFTGDGNYEPGEAKTASFEVKSIDCPLTINYQYEDGSEAAETHTEDVEIFTDYSVTSPEITGYTPDVATVEGTMGDDDMGGKTVIVTYKANTYKITYVVDGNETEVTYNFGAPVEKPADPVKDGFNFIGWDAEIPEKMPAENLTITAEFEAIPEPEEPTPTEPTPTEPTPTEPTPTEPTPTEPTPTDTEPAHEHDYKGEVTTKPTCTEDGIMTYTCECGETYTQAISKTGHKPGAWTVVTPATTEAAGKEVKKCEVCGEILAEREIAKLEPQETDAGIVSVNLEKTNAFGIANAFGVDPEKLPAGSTVTWYVNGEKAGEGNGFRVDNPTENYTIKAVVTNRDGKVIGETEETTVKVNNCFFARLYYWLCRIIQKVIDLFNK